MPSCYLLALAQASALDGSKNTWSLFNLVETLTVEVAGEGPIVAPVEVHCFWLLEAGELGEEFEWRVAVEPKGDGSSPAVTHSQTITSVTDKRRLRARLNGLVIREGGENLVSIDWKKPGDDDWQRCPIVWPLDVNLTRVEETQDEGS